MTLPPVTRVALAYGAGLWIGLVVFAPGWVFWVLSGCAALAGILRPRHAVPVGAVAIGLVAAGWHADRGHAECRHVWRAGSISALLTVHDAPGTEGTTTAKVIHATQPCRGTVRLRLARSVPAGATVLAVGIARGFGVMRVRHVRVLSRSRPWRYRVRAVVERRIRALYGARAGLVDALVLGRRDDLSPALRQTFADAGLAHLLAISGLHVGVLSSWLLLLLRRAGVGERRWLLGAALTWAYVSLLGMPASATRAAAFLTLYAVARWRQRHPPLAAVVAVSALLILSLDPGAATSIGLWLSVAAVLGTGWGNRLARGRRHPVIRLVASSCGAVLFTAPITAFAFGAVAPIGVVANLVAIPLSGIAVPAVFVSLAGGGLVAGGAGLTLATLERVAAVAARVPGAQVMGAPGTAFAVPWVLGLCGVLYLSGDRGAVLASPVVRVRRIRRLLAVSAAAVWLLVTLPAWRAREGGSTLDIHVLSVGQGDAILVRTPEDRWLLVDGGPRTTGFDAGARVILPFLRRRGVRALDVVVVSHGDADHLGGIPSVLDRVDAGLVLEPGQPLGTDLYLEYLALVDARGIAWRAARSGDTLTIDGLDIAVLHPSGEWVDSEFEPNENSLVLHVRYGCFDVLFAGDAGTPVEWELLPSVPEVEILKVGHHGSASGTTGAWLDALRPRVAVISVGRNRYGHPAPDVLARLSARNVEVRRTDRGGVVTIRTDGRYYWVDQGRPATLAGSLQCRIRQLSRSSDSSSSRSGCTLRPPVTSRICSTTSPSRPR